MAFVAVAFVALGDARADEKSDMKKAREHYNRGEKAFTAGRFEEAYKEFEAGYAVMPRPAFLLNMAHSERKRGEVRNARALYRKFLVTDPQSKYRAEVEEVLAQLDAVIAAEEPAASSPTSSPTTLAPPPAGAAPPALVTPPAPEAPPPVALQPAAPPPRPALDLAAQPDEPRAEPSRRPVYQRWWFWAAVGGVVAAGAGSALFLLSGDSYTKKGSLGTLGP